MNRQEGSLLTQFQTCQPPAKVSNSVPRHTSRRGPGTLEACFPAPQPCRNDALRDFCKRFLSLRIVPKSQSEFYRSLPSPRATETTPGHEAPPPSSTAARDWKRLQDCVFANRECSSSGPAKVISSRHSSPSNAAGGSRRTLLGSWRLLTSRANRSSLARSRGKRHRFRSSRTTRVFWRRLACGS